MEYTYMHIQQGDIPLRSAALGEFPHKPPPQQVVYTPPGQVYIYYISYAHVVWSKSPTCTYMYIKSNFVGRRRMKEVDLI